MPSFHAPYLSFFNVSYLDMDFICRLFWVPFFSFWWTGEIFSNSFSQRGQKNPPNQLQKFYLDKTVSDETPCCFERHIITYSCTQQGSDTVRSQHMCKREWELQACWLWAQYVLLKTINMTCSDRPACYHRGIKSLKKFWLKKTKRTQYFCFTEFLEWQQRGERNISPADPTRTQTCSLQYYLVCHSWPWFM